MEYEIITKPRTSLNNIPNAVVDESYRWMGILAAAEFAILSTTNKQNVYGTGQLIFGRDMILPIEHRVDWELLCQRKQTQINRDNTQENKDRVDYGYKVGDKFILTNHTAYKYETPYNVPSVKTQCLPMAR